MQSFRQRVASDAKAVAEMRETLGTMIADERGTEAVDLMIEVMVTLKQENQQLSLRLQKELKARYGTSSERLSAGQLSLFLGMLGADDSADDDVGPDPVDDKTGDPELDEHFGEKKKRKKNRKPTGRRPLPEQLPREEVVLSVPEHERTCTICGTDKRCIGHDRSEVLEWTPGFFKVLVFAREKLACKPCEGDVVIAPVADKVIEGGLPGPGLLTEIVLKKFKYAQPLWRQAHYFSTRGVDLAESTLCGWIKAAAATLTPVYNEIVRLALLCHCIQTDDSHIRVLDRRHPKGIKRGAMWVYIGDQKYAFFDYSPDRSSDSPHRILKGYAGKVQADAYSAYDFLFKGEEATATELGCMMHARRYFVEAFEASEELAAVPIRWFWHLYKIEEYAKDIGADDKKRLCIRREKSKPVMDKLGKWIAQHYDPDDKASPLSKAMGYSSRQWDALTRFIDDGAVEIDNGLSERVIRTVAIGRKNYMFAGSDAGAERAAILYSLIASCDLAQVDTAAYLRDVMMKIACGWPQSKISELIPANWALKHGRAAKTAA